jgi:glyoxylase-like metal-dependent hydrolase (beta-lactamase superfamily II)
LADGSVQDVEARTERGLTYPAFEIPDQGQAVPIAKGVLWLRLTLPLALNHVNIYAIEDGEGWVIVDTGMSNPDTVEAWEQILAGPLKGRPVTRVICTHMHPDHIGMAGWLCDRFDAPMLMSRLEYISARMLVGDEGATAPKAGEVMYRAAGYSPAQLTYWRDKYGSFNRTVHPLPVSYTRLSEGDVLRLGGDDWRIVIGEGHSPEHVCLWRASDGVFISGDQILPRISSNVSIWPTEPLADPLGDWLGALERLKAVLPSDLFVLPSHGEPFYGVTTRLEALLRGHEVALKRLERTLKTPSRAVDVFGALFARPVGDNILSMATGEALAHLNYLEKRGRIRRERDAEGVDWWTLAEDGE